jgi:hypothetical protein
MTEHAESPANGPVDGPSVDYRLADYPTVSRPMESSRIARTDASALTDLQLHWGSAYEIGLDGDIWSATFRGSADELRAHTCLELRVLIRADYAYRQLARGARRAADPADPASTTGADDPADDRPARRTGAGDGHGFNRGQRMSL